MSLSKKERRLTIWIGIAIGVACSSMLVRYAFNQKEIKAKERPGNYNSGRTAADQKAFPPLPFEAQKALPHGIVVFHDYNQSMLNGSENSSSWVVETTGNFRSERLFVLVEKNIHSGSIDYFRASEIYLLLQPKKNAAQLEFYLDESTQRVIGKNSKTHEFIIQIKDIKPVEIRKTLQLFRKNSSLIAKARVAPWKPFIR